MAEKLYFLIITFIVVEYLLSQILNWLNLKNWDLPLPQEIETLFKPEEHQKAKAYAKANYTLGLISSTFSVALILATFSLKGFAWVDQFARAHSQSPVVQSLIYFGILGLASQVVSLPFNVYS